MDGMETTLRICTKCPIRHYDNCPECFGFGKFVSAKSGDLIPIKAGEAHGHSPLPPNRRPCPFCGSTSFGVPESSPVGSPAG
jgi:RNA polymerase subunit RPABC4/transcription elongation factor Spt4